MDMKDITTYMNLLQEQVQDLQEKLNMSQQPNSKSQKLKIREPDIFRGEKGENIDDWLFQLQQYFEFYSVTDNMKIKYAANLLRGMAATWWRTHTNLEHGDPTGR